MTSREIITITDEAQWLAERDKDITSTGVSALYGLSPYVTEFELYQAHKNGVRVPFKETSHTKAGKAVEYYAAQVAAEKLSATHGPVASVTKLDIYARIPGERFGSSFDYEVVFEDGHAVLLEIKGVNVFGFKDNWLDGEAPDHIELQLQHQLEAIDRYEVGVIAAFTGIYPDDCHLFERPRDRELGQALRQRVREFWADVEAGREPAVDFDRDAAVIAEMFRGKAVREVNRSGDEAFEALLHRYLREKAESKAFDKAAKATQAEIHLMLGDAASAYTERFKVNASYTKDYVGKLVTPDMVGTMIGGRKGYRQLRVKDLTSVAESDDEE